MRVKFWGTRGSIPVPGPTTIRYGGNTTCVEVEGRDGTTLIIDAGTGIRALGADLMKRGENGPIHVLFTHFHWDHIQGWPFFFPGYLPKNEFILHGRASSPRELETIFSYQMHSTYFPVEYKDLPCKFEFVPLTENSLKIGGFHIQAIENCHPGGAFGLRIAEKRHAFVFITDHEASLTEKLPHPYADYVKFASKAELLVHDAQFTEEELPTRRTWGHSSYQECLKLAIDSGAKRLGLYHHAPERVDYEIDRFVSHCYRILEEQRKSVEVFGVMEGMEVTF
jgi:phosphoribosyl 1,2-cyclic phosphodiesterase